jgi:peptide/nickel transport system substrate-binding protein
MTRGTHQIQDSVDAIVETTISRRDLLARAGAISGAAGLAMMAGSGATSLAAPLAQTPAAGGTLTVALNADIATVDPHVSGLIVWGIIKENIFDQLGYFDPVELTVKPKLATEWAWEGDTALVVKLQPGVTFHDGAPLTSADVIATYDRVRNPDTGSPWATLVSDIDTIEAVDDTTVRFNTKTFSNKLVGALPWIDIISQAHLETADQAPPIGTGPFKWVEWKVNDQIVVERNADYWQEGKPLLDQIIFKPISEPETRLAAVESGQIEIVYDIALKDVERVEQSADLKVAITPPVDWLFTAYCNMRKPPFDNQKVRQAFATVIDREGFNEAFLGGHGAVTYGPFAKEHPAYNANLEGKFAYDLEAARALIEEAGYPGGQGLSFAMMVPIGYPEYKQLSELIQAAFGELGANVTIDEVELATWADRLLNLREFDVAVDGTRRCAADPAITFSGGYLFPPGPNNICGFMPEMLPDYVELIEQAASTQDQEARADLYRQAQEIFVEFAPGPMILHKPFGNGLRKEVEGFVPHPQYHQDFSTVWLNE